MKYRQLFIFFSILSVLLSSTGRAQTKVYLIPSLHGLHKQNQNYSYDSLKLLINRLNPDLIAVEIREIDVPEDTNYLKKNYPFEMWMMKYWFPATKVEGFDWLGEEIEGKLIPLNYWKEISSVKKCEIALSNDSLYKVRISSCDSFGIARMEILKTSSLKEILVSNDAALCTQYYNCYSTLLTGSDYELIPKFNNKRNEKILQNINEIIRKNRNKTIVVVTGDDHYVYLKHRISHCQIY
ncbi:MAG: hypothetical protein A2X13_14345 [Bacteroidetes bacterium GWC2_33_15]|nr:MAG: hypothetical protein A2X10_12390 [Bacteroidetes bacterium GWA2_33_15]OFX50054.1 MAG: hypothetical protein A2X13_14345 [Bacteroidetes bacterium GWC2_33_15]OFX65207.1 MAG: hypothetical protein A2X15_03920 [Bacteroidetes bacterium GWB2_32_14]OFX70433.1 MAG: hypothetical protein A2X14_03975 [Bacteroidetes bacterium GWD2_33_33]HAN19697.1 hypothetical protein [Bacteroidales bacterium]